MNVGRNSEDTLAGPEIATAKEHKRSDNELEHSEHGATSNTNKTPEGLSIRPDGKIALTEAGAPEVLGYAYPTWKKWSILCVIFIVQCSMNFNASIYANGVGFLTEKFDISAQAARVGQMIFLVSYAFGCELWAPWSEELGRWPTLQLSLFFVNGRFTPESSLTYSLADSSSPCPKLWDRCCGSLSWGYLISWRLCYSWNGSVNRRTR